MVRPVASPSLRGLPTLLAAVCLAVLGLDGMRRSPSQGLVDLLPSALADGSGGVSQVLEDRESALQRRRDAEVLLAQFVRGQMTRHYWGHFAASLEDLGLQNGEHLEARVERGDGYSRLWLMPRRGGEAFLADVLLRGGRLERRLCRGDASSAAQGPSLGCPAGWNEFAAEEISNTWN